MSPCHNALQKLPTSKEYVSKFQPQSHPHFLPPFLRSIQNWIFCHCQKAKLKSLRKWKADIFGQDHKAFLCTIISCSGTGVVIVIRRCVLGFYNGVRSPSSGGIQDVTRYRISPAAAGAIEHILVFNPNQCGLLTNIPEKWPGLPLLRT